MTSWLCMCAWRHNFIRQETKPIVRLGHLVYVSKVRVVKMKLCRMPSQSQNTYVLSTLKHIRVTKIDDASYDNDKSLAGVELPSYFENNAF
jgi:hypothetical protein